VVTAVNIRESTLLLPIPSYLLIPSQNGHLNCVFLLSADGSQKHFPPAKPPLASSSSSSSSSSSTLTLSSLLFLHPLISLKIYKENLCGYVGAVLWGGEGGGEADNNEAQRELMYCVKSASQCAVDIENCFLLFLGHFSSPSDHSTHPSTLFISLDFTPHFQLRFFIPCSVLTHRYKTRNICLVKPIEIVL
jgi:hypothetical protein